MKDIIIVGAGGVGKEVSWIIEQINSQKEIYNLLGFVDDDEKKYNENINGYKVLGGINYILENNYEGEVIIAIANYYVKKSIVERLMIKNIQYAKIVHPNINFPKGAEIGEGTIIYEGVVISPDVRIGKHVIISPKCGIGHDSFICDYVSLLWNVNISGNDIIGEGAYIGSNVTVIQNKRLEKGIIVGAGAVVIDDVDEFKTVVGIPAKCIRLSRKVE